MSEMQGALSVASLFEHMYDVVLVLLVQAGVLRTCARVVGAVDGFGFRPRLQGSRFTGLYKLCISGGFFRSRSVLFRSTGRYLKKLRR